MVNCIISHGLVQGVEKHKKNFEYVDIVVVQNTSEEAKPYISVTFGTHVLLDSSDDIFTNQLEAALKLYAPTITLTEAMDAMCLWHKKGPVDARNAGTCINNNRNILRWQASLQNFKITLYSFRVPVVQHLSGLANVYTTTSDKTSTAQHRNNATGFHVEQVSLIPPCESQLGNLFDDATWTPYGPRFIMQQEGRYIAMCGTSSDNVIRTTLVVKKQN